MYTIHKRNKGTKLNQVRWNFIPAGYLRKYKCKASGRGVDLAINRHWEFTHYGK